MTETVTTAVSGHTGSRARTLYQALHRSCMQRLSFPAYKEAIGTALSKDCHPAPYCFLTACAHMDNALLLPFSLPDKDRTALEVNIGYNEVRKLGKAHTGIEEEEYDGPVPRAQRCPTVALVQQPSYFIRRKRLYYPFGYLRWPHRFQRASTDEPLANQPNIKGSQCAVVVGYSVVACRPSRACTPATPSHRFHPYVKQEVPDTGCGDDLNILRNALLVALPQEVIEQTLVVCYTVGVDFPSLINVMK